MNCRIKHIRVSAWLFISTLIIAIISATAVITASGASVKGQKADFIETIGSLARDDMEKSKILPSLTVAQAIVESGWGSSTLAEQANNLFGMKGSYNGASYTIDTLEYTSAGKAYIERSKFKKYSSWAQSVKDHSELFTSSSRYSNLVGCTDYKLACKYVREDGYATASNYTSSLISIIEQYNLDRFDKPTEKNPVYTQCYYSAEAAAQKTYFRFAPAAYVNSKSTAVKWVAKGTALTVTGVYTDEKKQKWYFLDSGYYVYSGGVTLKGKRTSIALSMASYPNSLTEGNDCDISGTVISLSGNLESVSAAVYSSAGKRLILKTSKPTGRVSFNLADLNSSVEFSTLAKGKYYFAIYAKNKVENIRLSVGVFYVLDSSSADVIYSASGATNVPAAQYAKKGAGITLSSAIPRKPGFCFIGWTTDPSTKNVGFLPGDCYVADEPIILYGVFTPVSISTATKNISLDISGQKTETAKLLINGYIESGTTLTLTAPDKTIAVVKSSGKARDGNICTLSYTVTAKGTGTTSFTLALTDKKGKTLSSCKTTLTVTKKNTFSISYSSQGGSGAPGTQTKIKGKALALRTDNPTRSGYTFVGWSRQAGAKKAELMPGAKYTEEHDIILYAVWQKTVLLADTAYISLNISGTTSADVDICVKGDADELGGYYTNHTDGITVSQLKEYSTADGYHYVLRVTAESPIPDGILKIAASPQSRFSDVYCIVHFKIIDTKINGYSVGKDGTKTYYCNGNVVRGYYVTTQGVRYIRKSFAEAEGITLIGGKKYYYKNGLRVTNSFVTINKKTYYFGADGVMRNGLQTVGEDKYLFLSGVMQTGAVKYGGKYYLFSSSGKATSGYAEIDGARRYFDSTGCLANGITVISGSGSYFFKNGIMQTGFVVSDKKTYYFYMNGKMAHGMLVENNSLAYYVSDDGTVFTGTVKVNGKSIDFSEKGVNLQGVVTVGKYTYSFTDLGKLQTGFVTVHGKTRYFDYYGKMLIGLRKISGSYYMFGTDGVMQTGFIGSGKTMRYFYRDGKMAMGLCMVQSKYYFFGSDGYVRTGFVQSGKNTYYIPEPGKLQTGCVKIDGKWYLFRTNGVMYKGFITSNGVTHYFGTDGVMVTGLVKIDGKWYCFSDAGRMAVSCFVTYKGIEYYADSHGVITIS